MAFLIGGALVVGLSLGLLGSGGSILTVPVLVYLLNHVDKVAIAESLAIVGGIALVGALPYARQRLVNWRSVLLFGVPGMAGTFFGAWVSQWVPGAVQLVVFAAVILVAAWMMFRQRELALDNAKRRHAIHVALDGLAVGVLTGFVGVGGGFLIVPALVLLGNLPMREAIGTSLLIIALKSATGLVKYLGVLEKLELGVDWTVIAVFVAVGVVGSAVGHRIGGRLNGNQLRRAFAVVLVVMGLFIFSRELPGLVSAATR